MATGVKKNNKLALKAPKSKKNDGTTMPKNKAAKPKNTPSKERC